MIPQEPADARQRSSRPSGPAAVAALAATLVVVGLIVGVWAVNNDGGPVAAEDARIEITFTGDEASFAGDRDITEGVADVVFINESTASAWFLIQRFDTGSDDIEAYRGARPDIDITSEDVLGETILLREVPEPGRVTESITLEPGTYILDAGLAGDGTPLVLNAAVIEVVSD